ncbi:hypothetical protein GMMP15_50039 [Candidatus Magnetomoraceae bacterium gMMP-15]
MVTLLISGVQFVSLKTEIIWIDGRYDVIKSKDDVTHYFVVNT